ncbi:actin depolymerizing protein [Ramaria rubella]|nr:actin depolymerizing protein [Ramaria rubella]
MSATSGIPIHADLQHAFAAAQHGPDRFLKLAIRDELIVLDSTTPAQGDLSSDLNTLQDLLQHDSPAYVLAKLDDPAQWLAITYVPDSARVRDKMLYASTRATLMKSLGSASFSDSLFATSKADLTPDAYAAHLRHQAAPQPLSAREQAMADVLAAERKSGSQAGPAARVNHLGGTGVQLAWGEDVVSAVGALGHEVASRLVVMRIDPSTETLLLSSNSDCAADDVGAALPSSDPSYAFFAWSHPHRDIVLIYSCPSTSPIKHRMLFSSGLSSVLTTAKALGVPVTRKIETSDPQEVDGAFLRAELSSAGSGTEEKKIMFAKPRGPMRKQR